MSEIDIIIRSKNKVKSTKRSKTEYIDLNMAILNSILIIFLFTLMRNRTIILSLFGLIFIAILLIGTIITFLKRNPYYIFFCYGLTLCGVLGNVFGFIKNPFFAIIFIPQSLYVYSIIEYSFLGKGRSAYLYTVKEPNYYIFSKKTHKQISEENRRREIEEYQKQKIEKKFKLNVIALTSIFCSIGLFITLIVST